MPKEIAELAMEYALAKPPFSARNEPDYKDRMHAAYLAFEEMVRRTGIDYTIKAIEKAKETLTIVGV